MAEHQYWRLTGFLTDSNALELSQAQLYDGATLIAQAPTFSVAPTSGTAFPDTLHWNDCTMPGFALVWNLATPVASPNLRLGAGSSTDNFPKELYCQYSDDGKFWGTNNAPVNIDFPGAGLLTAAPGTGVTVGDPDFSKVSFLLKGANTDLSLDPAAVTLNNATLNGGVRKFSQSSIQTLADHTSYVSTPNSPKWDFGDGDFTIEMWVQPVAIPASGSTLIGRWGAGGSGGSNADWLLYVSHAGYVSFLANGLQLGEIGPLPVNGQFHHVAVTRSAGVVRVFIAGVASAPISFGEVIQNSPYQDIRMGVWNDQLSYLNGYFDSVRVTKGIARYTTTFTPPTAAFPTSVEGDVTGFIPLSTKAAAKRWRATGTLAEHIAGSEMPEFDVQLIAQEESFMDAYHGGQGRLYGTVKQKNTPENTPLRRRVDLMDERSRLVIRSTWSDTVTGIYAFSGIREDLVYTVVSYDPLHSNRAVIADNLTLANGGVELMP